MKVFNCGKCGDGCILSELDDSEKPDSCIYSNAEFDPDWKETTEYQITKIEKPAKVKFSDAIHEMKLGDSFNFGGEVLTMVENEDGNEMTVFVSDQHHEYVLLEPEMLKKEGVIVKPGPKVLSAEEWEKITPESIITSALTPMNPRHVYEDIMEAQEIVRRMAYKAGHQNGRLERDFEYKNLRDCVKKYCGEGTYSSLALGNLKPLNKK